MLTTQIQLLILIFIIVEILMLFISWIIWKGRKSYEARIRFLVFILFFLLYNITAVIYVEDIIGISQLSLDFIAFTIGTAYSLYFLYYFYKEYNIRPSGIFALKPVIYITVLDLLLLFIIPYSITRDIQLSKYLFLAIPLLLIIGISINVFREFYKRLKSKLSGLYITHILWGFCAMICIMLFLIISISNGMDPLVEYACFSMGHIFLTLAYVIYPAQLSYDNKNNVHLNLDLFDTLTVREQEIALLIKECPNRTYRQLSEIIHINEKTFSKHTSNIYKKLRLHSNTKKALIRFLNSL